MRFNPRLRFHPLGATAAELRGGQRSLTAYVNEICDHIDRVEPEIQALLPEENRRARLLREAAALEARYPVPDDYVALCQDPGGALRTGKRPPLYGVLVGVKDIVRADGFPTTCGSALPPEIFAGPEASCVTRLREAGALILGKTVTTEFAYFEPGPTRNPWGPDHTPGGSSSGSAAAVAAGYCALALGSQTIGSVIRPAAFCGVVGFKPSYGLLPLDGVIPYAPTLDTLGFFVQQAYDLPLAMSVLSPGFTESVPGYHGIAVPEGPYLHQATAVGVSALETQVAYLLARGRKVHRVRTLGNVDEVNQVINDLAAAELAETHRDWFPNHEQLYGSRTARRIRYGQSIPPEGLATLRARAAELREELQSTIPGQEALKRMAQDDPDAFFARLHDPERFSAWICPAATGPAPEGIRSTGDPCMNGPWTLAGMPAITVPAGTAQDGMPLGLQCVGAYGDDAWLVSFANQVSQELERVRYPWS